MKTNLQIKSLNETKKIKEILAEFLKQNDVSQSSIAKKINVSTATLSQYLQGKYNGDVKTLETKIKQFLDREKSRKQTKDFVFIDTSLSQKIQQSCNFAFDTQDMILIVGGSGVGKTEALKQFARKTEAAIYIECDLTLSPKNILQEIAQQLNIDLEKIKNIFALNSAVLKELNNRDVLLIFDEAELLSYKTLETIRRIHDKSGTAVVLAGMPKLRANLKGKKGDFLQLFSRIGIVIDVGSEVPQADLEKVISGQDDFASFSKELSSLAQGNLRRLTKIAKGCRKLLQKGESLNEELFKTYASFLLN